MKTLFTLFISLFTYSAIAQVPQPNMLWLKGYGGNSGISPDVSKQLDGGFILSLEATTNVGNIDSFCSISSDKTLFIKYNSDASVLEWTKCYSRNSSDSTFIYMFSSTDGGYILGGLGSGETHEFLIHKESATGVVLWSKSYGDTAEAIIESMMTTEDNGYIIVGETNYTSADFTVHYGSSVNDNIAVIKIDSNGNKLWSKVIGGTGDNIASTVVSAPNNGCYVVGSTTSNDYDCIGNNGGSDAYIVRLDKNGNIIWHKDLGGAGDDNGNSGWPDGKGGIIIGATSGSNNGDVTHQISYNGVNIWVLNVDSSGNIVWNNSYGGDGSEYTHSVCKAVDGSIWIAGDNDYRDSFEVDTFYGGNDDAWFLHIDSVGNFLNAQVLGSSKQDEGYMIYPLSSGNVIAGGYFDTSDGSFSNLVWYSGNDAFLTVFAPLLDALPQMHNVSIPLEIYPNPATESVNIKLECMENTKILITDILGRQIYFSDLKTGPQILRIVISAWPDGVYCVQLISENGYKTASKLVIE